MGICGSRHLREVSHPRLAETPFRSPQLTLFDLGPDEWLLYWRVPAYTKAVRPRRVSKVVQMPLFDFSAEAKAVGAEERSGIPRARLHLLPQPTEDSPKPDT